LDGEDDTISIEGTLLMLDDTIPHVAVPVQAIRKGKVLDGTLSDERGKYRFINLKPGRYQVRCQVLRGYIYYSATDDALRFTAYESDMREGIGDLLAVEPSKTLKNIDFRFAPFKKGTWRSYDIIDGLPDNFVSAIYQDPNGVMWFGTSNGVSLYDGNEFKNFTTKDGLASDMVYAIYRTPDGVMWFGTRNGVSQYDGKKFVNLNTKNGLAHNSVSTIHRGLDGVMWFATGGGGISQYDGKEFVNFTVNDGLVNNYVRDISSAPDGTLWFGTLGGLSRYANPNGRLRLTAGKRFENFTTKDGLASNYIHTIHVDLGGVIWIGTWEGGVSRYDGNQFVNLTTKDGLANNYVDAIHVDSGGVVWIGTWGGGLSRYDGKTFVNFTHQDGLPGNLVNSICSDDDGGIWVGVRGSGVSRYNENHFVNFTTKDGLGNNTVLDIHGGADGVIWFGTIGGGVSRYDGKKILNFTTKDGLAGDRIYDIYCDPHGVMWFGTFLSGVSRYDGKQFKNFTTKDGLAGHQIFAMNCDSDGMMWFATYGSPGGLSRYDGKQFKNFTTKDGLVDNNVHAIYCDPDGVMWFGTTNGISRYDGKEFTNFNTANGLVDNCVGAIYGDPNGMMWFGTKGGISRYDGKEFKNLTAKDGLENNSIRAIHRDHDGLMWFVGNGVCFYDGITWATLDKRDGLAGNGVTSIHQDADGYLWFGTNDGVTRYRRTGNKHLSVRVVSVRTDKEYTELQDLPPITIGHRVTIAYNAMDFKTIPEKRQYRVRILNASHPESVDAEKAWEKPTKSPAFDWIAPKAGTYTFQVQAIDRDLNYSEPANLKLKIVTPFYLRTAFLLPTIGGGTILIAVLIIVSIAYLKRLRQVQAYQQLAVEELQDARQVQMGLMPDAAPPIEGLEIAGKCLPANDVSGDFFDYLEGKHENEIGLVIADVTGKAMKGAMNAVMTDGILRMAAEEMDLLSPSHLMIKINRILKARTERLMNVTMIIGMINAETKTLTLANAGHHALPMICRQGEIQELQVTGFFPLGITENIQYSEEKFQLQSGDVLILMTDGIIEVQDIEENYYSDSDRLEKIISQFAPELPAEAMVDAVINDAIAFGGEKAKRDDDMTVVVAKVL